MFALRVYRLLPRGLRRRMLNVVPPRLWIRYGRAFLPPQGMKSAQPIGVELRLPDNGVPVRALVVDQAGPLQMWHRNLTAVTDALDRAGIDYFCLRNKSPFRSAVAVRVHHRAMVWQLLRSATELRDALVRRVKVPPGQHRPDATEEVIQVLFPVTNAHATLVFGEDFACEVEFWTEQADRIIAPRDNPVSHEAPAESSPVSVPAWLLSDFAPVRDTGRHYRTRSDFSTTAPERVRFPIDAVFTWVDGSDPEWHQRMSAVLRDSGDPLHTVAVNASRYVSRDELRYSLRSVVTFAPWIRHIYLVTDDQLPAWLDAAHPMVTVVPHREILAGHGRLPSFNSHAIESALHRVPGLAEHFLYFNDDVFLGRPLLPTTFFHANGIAKLFISPAQYGTGEVTPDDLPVNAAGKNNRRHLHRLFGVTISQKMKHTPFALRRSVLEQIEAILPEETAATASHQFRHPDDLSIPSSLHAYWVYLTGQGVPATIEYEYADLGHPSTPARLADLLARRDRDVFCLNDTDSDRDALAEQEAMLADFLPRYLPFAAPFELPDDVVAERSRRGSTALWREEFGGHEKVTSRARTVVLRAPPGSAWTGSFTAATPGVGQPSSRSDET